MKKWKRPSAVTASKLFTFHFFLVKLSTEMELEFDKEMDSLLRKSGEAGRGVLVGDVPAEKPKVHLDADQLSAFAENAIPERSRALYMSHLADCDRCRRILSGLITLNAEAMPAEERAVAPAISTTWVEPWYRRLFLPNLAYVMGGLVLVFGGMIAISVFQSSNSGEATVSQSVETAPAARGPMFEDGRTVTDQMANTNAASMAANKPAAVSSANAPANAASSSTNAAPPEADSGALRKETLPRDQPGYSLDGDAAKLSASAPAAAPPPPAPAIAAPKREDAESREVTATELKDEGKARSAAKKKIAEGEKADALITSRQVQDLPLNQRQAQEMRTQAGGVAKATPGPSRDNAQNFPNRANNTFEILEEKRVSGKGFQRRNNVWYDNSYRGGVTTNVRRGTDEYRKLDGGLRSIAESLNGVVVVVWSGRAYRIQ